MRIEDYPGNEEITQIRQAIIELHKNKEWEAIVLAKTDLYYLLKHRENWVKS